MKLFEIKKTKKDLPIIEKIYTWEKNTYVKQDLYIIGISIIIFIFLVGSMILAESEEEEDIPTIEYHVPNNNYNLIDIDSIIIDKAKKYNLDPLLIKSIISHESKFKIYATGAANDLGLMQVLDINMTKKELLDPFNPHNNIEAGSRYLYYCFKKYGNTKKALSCYNMGLNGNYNSIYVYNVCTEYKKMKKKFSQERFKQGRFKKNCL